ncbi:phosphate acyltransferase PlsX [Falsigemmobacter intermedius]|uniref:phosphate acyltransferase PlsX n=1 Tax=Falsigemmobacter intermedius TaxID=1553448 RepID=UPI003F0EF826
MTQSRPDPRAPVASATNLQQLVISVDAMGGDRGPEAVVGGLELAAAEHPDARFILHGDQAVLTPLLDQKRSLSSVVTLRHAVRAVTMHDKPSQIMRSGQDTSMWSCIEAVRLKEAQVAVSCGNTGALMAVSMIRLRRLRGVTRPAIACLWPSRNKAGFNVMLDVGADVKADPEDLLQYARMGAAYARTALSLDVPRVGLLNVGTEEHKGRPEMRTAYELVQEASEDGAFSFEGFVEGGDIPGDRVDVIVTDGFSGNIALKTGEGTAKFVGEVLKSTLRSTLLSKVGALLAMSSLKKMQLRIDPRRVNGGVFLGLNGAVVKSHGSSDATGVAAAISLACQLAREDFTGRIAAQVAPAAAAGQDAASDGEGASN